MIDSHGHLTHARFRDDLPEVLSRARTAGVEACVTIGTGVEDASRARALARAHPGFVHATAGLDPFSAHEAGDRFDEAFAELEALLAEGGFVALGEIGLDYHYDLDPRPAQAERFERQLDLARRLALPVVIHVRDAHDDMAAILGDHSEVRGVIHSFTGGPRDAARYLDLGWHLAFNGVVTFRSAPEVRESARLTPADRLLVETDAPYLAPVPHRGRRCEPAHVADTVAALAVLREDAPGRLGVATARNACRLFRLPAAAGESVQD